SDLFREGGGAAADVAATDFDLDLGATGTPPAQPDAADSVGLEFNLDDLETPRLEPASLDIAPDKGEALEFDLSQFDLAEPEGGAPAGQAPADKPAADAGNTLDFDLEVGAFDAGTPAAPPPQPPKAEPPAAAPVAAPSSP